MSETAAQIIATFESLPPQEQHEVLTEMLRKSGELPDTILSDEGLAGLADDLFRTLDAEEADGNHAGSR